MSDNLNKIINNKITDVINLPRMQNTFTASNLLGILCNVFLFIVVQTGFFYFVASKQFNNVLESKVDIMNIYLKNNENAKQNMKEYINSESVKEIKKIAKEQEVKRDAANIELMKADILPLLLFTGGLIILVIFAMYTNKRNQWSSFNKTDQILLASVLFAYTTEMAFFFGVVKQFEFYGDHAIVNKFYNSIKEKFEGKGNVDIDNTIEQAQVAYDIYQASDINEYKEKIETAQNIKDTLTEEGWTAY